MAGTDSLKKLGVMVVLSALFFVSAAGAGDKRSAVLFVFDGSGSMWGQVDGKNKIVLARDVMADLVPSLPETVDVGLIAYGHRRKDDCGDIELVVPVGGDRANIVQAVKDLNPRGSTPLAGALAEAGKTLENRTGPASIVLVSDGKASCEGDPCAAARELREAGVNLKVHVVGFDVNDEEAQQLRCIAEEGGGNYWAAGDAEQLNAAFEDVRETVEKAALGAPEEEAAESGGIVFEDRYERQELGDDWKVLHEDRSSWLLDDGYLVLTKPAIKKKIDDRERWVAPNTLSWQGNLPEDFEVISEWDVDFQPGRFWGQQVFIQVEGAGGVSVSAGFRYGDYRSAGAYMYLGRFFRKGTPGQEPNEIVKKGKQVGKNPGNQKLRIKLVKKNYNFTAYAQRTGEKDWQEIGSQKILRFKDPVLSLAANNYSDAPETTAHLRHVIIREVE